MVGTDPVGGWCVEEEVAYLALEARVYCNGLALEPWRVSNFEIALTIVDDGGSASILSESVRTSLGTKFKH